MHPNDAIDATSTNTSVSSTASTPIGSTGTGHATAGGARYLRPDALTKRFVNPIVMRLTRLGLSMRGSRVLEVRGRTSGEWRRVPVNLLVVDGERFLVAPRGRTQWVRNLEAAGSGRLRLGRRVDEFEATAVADDDKAPIIRAYLREWAREVGRFFDGLSADSSDDEVRAAASGFPVFRITP